MDADDDDLFLATLDLDEQINKGLARRRAIQQNAAHQQPPCNQPAAVPTYQQPQGPPNYGHQQPIAPQINNNYPPVNPHPAAQNTHAYNNPHQQHQQPYPQPYPQQQQQQYQQQPYPQPPAYVNYASHHGTTHQQQQPPPPAFAQPPPPFQQQLPPYQQQQPPYQQQQQQGQYHQQSMLPPPLPQHQQQLPPRPPAAAIPNMQQQQPQLPPAQPPVVTIHATLELCKPENLASMVPPINRTQEPSLEVKMGYHDAAHNALKQLKGGTWDSRRRSWLFPLSAHDTLLAALENAQGVRVRIEPLHSVPATVLKISAQAGDDSVLYSRIPAVLETQLMPFQRLGVKFALSRGGRCLIGDEMGLGKTVQAIALAAAYREDWPGLIIAPSSLREQWAEALFRWLGVTEDRVHVVHSGKDAQSIPHTLDFLVVSYNFVDKMDLEKRFNLVICDESHYIKDPKAQRSKAVMPVVKSAKRAILLSGTPALNRPKEIYTQLSSILPATKLKMADFGGRYCYDENNRFDKYAGASNLDELHCLLRSTIMVRRLKNEVLTQLPRKRRQQVFLTLDGAAKRELVQLQRQLEDIKTAMSHLAAVNAASHGAANIGGGRAAENAALMEMYHKCAELKCSAVQEYVELLLAAGQKFLIFAHHKVLLDAIEHTLNRSTHLRGGGGGGKGGKNNGGVGKFIRIDGSTPAQSRTSLVNAFQEDDRVRVALLGIKAAGVGLTLTAASLVVFAEMTWTPGEIIQAEDRAHRIGQASSVNVQFLHVRNSVDDIIWSAVQNKLENLGHAIDGKDQAMEMGVARNMPERGQRQLDTFVVTQSHAGAVVGGGANVGVQQQQQQGGDDDGGVNNDDGNNNAVHGGGGGNNGSGGQQQQVSLLNYFPHQQQQQQQQQQVGEKRPRINDSQESW